MPRYVYWEMSGTFMVPDDTILDGSAIVLPSGDRLKLFEAFELNEEEDLDCDQRLKLGIDNCFGDFNRIMEIYDDND